MAHSLPDSVGEESSASQSDILENLRLLRLGKTHVTFPGGSSWSQQTGVLGAQTSRAHTSFRSAALLQGL